MTPTETEARPLPSIDTAVDSMISLAKKGEIISMYNMLKTIEDNVVRETAKGELKKILKWRGFCHQLYEAKEYAKKGDWMHAETSLSYARRIANFCQSDALLATARWFGAKFAIIYGRKTPEKQTQAQKYQ